MAPFLFDATPLGAEGDRRSLSGGGEDDGPGRDPMATVWAKQSAQLVEENSG